METLKENGNMNISPNEKVAAVWKHFYIYYNSDEALKKRRAGAGRGGVGAGHLTGDGERLNRPAPGQPGSASHSPLKGKNHETSSMCPI